MTDYKTEEAEVTSPRVVREKLIKQAEDNQDANDAAYEKQQAEARDTKAKLEEAQEQANEPQQQTEG